MTLKHHKNHYNVKFLSGYGLSLSLKDNKIQLKNGTYPYSDKTDSEEWFITNMPYEKIAIWQRIQFHPQCLYLMFRRQPDCFDYHHTMQ